MNEAIENTVIDRPIVVPEHANLQPSHEVQAHQEKIIKDLISNTVQPKPVELKLPEEPKV